MALLRDRRAARSRAARRCVMLSGATTARGSETTTSMTTVAATRLDGYSSEGYEPTK